MLTKLFALIDAYKILREGVEFFILSWHQYQMASYSGKLDEKQKERNFYLEEIQKAQEARDENAVKYFSSKLAQL